MSRKHKIANATCNAYKRKYLPTLLFPSSAKLHAALHFPIQSSGFFVLVGLIILPHRTAVGLASSASFPEIATYSRKCKSFWYTVAPNFKRLTSSKPHVSVNSVAPKIDFNYICFRSYSGVLIDCFRCCLEYCQLIICQEHGITFTREELLPKSATQEGRSQTPKLGPMQSFPESL